MTYPSVLVYKRHDQFQKKVSGSLESVGENLKTWIPKAALPVFVSFLTSVIGSIWQSDLHYLRL